MSRLSFLASITAVVTVALAIALGTPVSAAPVVHTSFPAALQDNKVFFTNGDYVHISSTAPRTASGHGWWTKGESDATEADVTIQLQINRNGTWAGVGSPGKKRVKPGGGSANRANARVVCTDTSTHEWRSVVDTDLVGYADSSETITTPGQRLDCGA